MEGTFQIYDKTFKRIFSLSNLATVNLINGLFNTNYPTNSEVVYLNNEFVRRDLTERFADVVLQIQGNRYHLEAQMQTDQSIVLRVFEYGYYVSLNAKEGQMNLRFPEPMVIYLDEGMNCPKESELCLDFGSQGQFIYKVPNFIYQEHEITELNQKKMVLLIPFRLLKLKSIIKQEVCEENLKALQKLIQDDIMGSIKANRQVGNITAEDEQQLMELTQHLYEYLTQHYDELGGNESMKELLPGALELPNDKYRKRIDQLEEEKSKIEEEKSKVEEEKSKIEEEKSKVEEEKTKIEEENEKLRAKIRELENGKLK